MVQVFPNQAQIIFIINQLTDKFLAMSSFFQKYHRVSHNSKTSCHTHENSQGDNNSTAQFRNKNSQSRQSYLKAFKKYYIEKLLQNKAINSENENRLNSKENFCFHQTRSQGLQERSIRQQNQKLSTMTEQQKKYRQNDLGKISRSKIVNLVSNNESQLEQVLYNSITQIQRQMMSFGEENDLARQNKVLKSSLDKLKRILKQKLQVALKKNKKELTIMFDQYSTMIKKLLEDKEQLTKKLEQYKDRIEKEERRSLAIEEQYQNKIRIIVEDNNAQTNNTKKQVEEFLEMIIQYQEESNLEKQQLEKLREKVVELQMENGYLKDQRGIFGEDQRNSFQEQQNTFQHEQNTYRQNLPETFGEISRDPFREAASLESKEEGQLQEYAHKISNLIDIIEKLQNENNELHAFLKICKCSKIKCSKDSSTENGENELIKKYQKMLVEAEKQYIENERVYKSAMDKKNQTIDRLNIVIEQMRRLRYSSIDKITEQQIKPSSR